MLNELGTPFKDIFQNTDIANWAFDLMQEASQIFNITSNEDRRFTVYYRKDKNGIHYNFCERLILGFYGTKKEGIKVRICLLEKEIEGLRDQIHYDESDRFSGEPYVVSCTFTLAKFNELSEQIMPAYKSALIETAKKYSKSLASSYRVRGEHIDQLGKAIFDLNYRVELFKEGIQLPITKKGENYWVFQCNPDIFDFVQAVKDQKLKTWRVAAHKNKIQKGDKVILWLTGSQSGCYALASVSSNVSKQTEHPEEQLYYRTQQVTEETERCEIEIEYSLVDQPIMKELVRNNPILKDLNAGHQGTNFVATKEQYEELLRLATERKLQPRYLFEDLCSETGLSENDLTSWLRAIERKGQAILYGPPGTGKTYVAKRLAKYLVSETDGLVDLVQFHPAYSYEDFIQGIRPQSNEAGMLTYTIKSGHFLEFCKKAAQRSGTCVLIIDEINRANLSRVFGELMYTLEYRNEEVVLASRESFKIPQNVRIIGTMNTADRSIALVDHALRRRFAFSNLKPNYEVLTRYHQQYGFNTSGLIEVLTKLNQSISDPNYEIGISFFMVENLRDELKHIWKMEIEPYLEEYFFAQSDVLNRFRWDRVKEQVKW